MQRIVTAALALLAGMAISIPGPGSAQTRPWGEGYFPNLPVVTQDGQTRPFYDGLIKGRIVVINFIYTSCKDICPLTTARMTQVEEKLGDLVGREIFLISMTVDPANDTPAALNAYAEAFHAGPGWSFVTGRPEDIKAINRKLGDKSRTLSDHRNEIVLGNDSTGEWARDSLFGDLDRLILSIRSMDPVYRDQVQVLPPLNASTNMGYSLATEPGQALFKKICAPCHSIGVGDRVGPDLRGITARRARPWLTAYIRDPEKVRASRDPIAVSLAAKFPGVRMPNLRLSETDADDLVTFLHAETSRLAAAAQDPAIPKHGPGGHKHHRH